MSKNHTAAVFRFIIISFLAGAALFSRRSRSSNNGKREDLYFIGKKGSPKIVVGTNQTPGKMLKNAVKSCIDSIGD